METVTYESYQTNIHPLFGALIGIIYLLIAIWFFYNIYRCVSKIPENQRVFPAWFAWLCLIPVIGYVFMWMVLPFGVGKSLQQHENVQIQAKGRTLFGLGLALVILPLLTFIPLVNIFISITMLVLFILYWVNISQTNSLLYN
jgi:cobalamin synthase